MVKSELYKDKFISAIMRSLLTFPVNRHTADIKSLKEAVRIVGLNEICGIFPEGTRSKSSQLLPFEKGTAFLALQSKSTVIPAYIAPKRKLGRVLVAFGESIEVSKVAIGKSAREKTDSVTEYLSNAVLKLGEVL